MSDKQIISSDAMKTTPVMPEVADVVARGRAAGIEPEIDAKPATAVHPRDNLPKYRGKMRGELPDNHPDRLRAVALKKEAMRREQERDQLTLDIEAGVEQKLRLGAKVVIKGNAKVDYEDKETGRRVRGDYGGIEGEVYQTYVDHEGKRRYIIVDRTAENGGHSTYAPAGVRECDLGVVEGRRFHSIPQSPERRAELAAEQAERHASMSAEDHERAVYGGLTAKELADKMCGL